jgi:hypothetical protein
MNVIKRAVELFNDESFRAGPANPQGHDFEIAHGLTHSTLEKWQWRAAHNEARLERAVENGKAHIGMFGIHYTDVSEDYGRRLLEENMADIAF